MLLSIAATLLLVCSAGNDSLPPLPLPLDQLPGESMVADSSPGVPGVAGEEIQVGDSAKAASVDRDSSEFTTATRYPIHRLFTVQGVNIETAESDIIDDDGNEVRRSVFLEEHQQKMGLNWIVTGGVLGGIGALVLLIAIDYYGNLPTFMKNNAGMLMSSGILFVGGGVILNIGIPQLRKHSRWHKRYELTTIKSKTSEQ